MGKTWSNPYDMGLKRNWEQVYGTRHPVAALLMPSLRQPEFLPVPLEGETGKRRRPTSSKPCFDANTTTSAATTNSTVRRRNDTVNLV